MSDERGIPITNKKTGEISFGSSVRSQMLPTEKNRPIEHDSGAVENSDDSIPKPVAAASPEGGASPVGEPERLTQDERPKGEAKKPPRPKIENLEQFIAHAYARRGQRVKLNQPLENLLCKQPKLDDEARGRLLDLAQQDALLAVPRQLLLAFRDVKGFTTLKNSVREFVGEVLVRHPIFGPLDLVAALKSLPNAPDPDKALTLLATADLGSFPGLLGDKARSPKALQELRVNAAYCLAVWFAETRGLALERLNQGLFAALWKPAADAAKSETAKLRFLTEIRDVAGAGLAAASFKQQADGQAGAVLVAQRAHEVLQTQNQALSDRLEALQAEIVKRDQRIADLEQDLTRERQDHEHARIHLKDDYEQLRTRLLRRLKAEVSLLTDGLQALRRDPPKTHVMDDHAERALDGLRKEIQGLESGE